MARRHIWDAQVLGYIQVSSSLYAYHGGPQFSPTSPLKDQRKVDNQSRKISKQSKGRPQKKGKKKVKKSARVADDEEETYERV